MQLFEAELRRMVAAYMDLCDRESVAWADLYAAVKVEQRVSPTVSPAELFQRAWTRARVVGN